MQATFGADRRTLVRIRPLPMPTMESLATTRRMGDSRWTAVRPKEQGIAAHEMEPKLHSRDSGFVFYSSCLRLRGVGQENVPAIALRIDGSVADPRDKAFVYRRTCKSRPNGSCRPKGRIGRSPRHLPPIPEAASACGSSREVTFAICITSVKGQVGIH